tara:strand:+ start:3222 stop:5570 length:2349 start_codon:yes stop_codon:yes gene_type:complete
MSDIYHLDFETYSTADLKSFGAYRYASDTSTEILILAIVKNDQPVVHTWQVGLPVNVRAIEMLGEAIASGAPIYAHNAQFEAAICKFLLKSTFGLEAPDLGQWRCTAAMARRAAIPSSLAGAGEFLNILHAKDTSGKGLIRKFSIPRRATKNDPRARVMPGDDREDFSAFVEYCRQDVEAEREIHKKLAAFELKGPVLESFQFDLAMNDRGVPVNVPALARVNALIDEYTERLTKQFQEITGFNPTQRAKVLEWVQERGFPFDNLQAAQVELVLKNGPSGWSCRRKVVNSDTGKDPVQSLPVEITPEAFEALKVRSNISYAAVKKVPTMLGAACPDNMVRGSLMWSGAERTHRWAGRIIQPQNFRRPTIKGTEQAYKMLCEGADIDTIEMLFAPFLEVVASSIRHFIDWPGGNLNQADFSSVEARGAAWLCGGERKLEMFRNNKPIYESQAANIFGCRVDQVDSEMRFIGKQAELGCTYQMGRPKFRGTCENFNYQPSPAMVEAFKPRFKKMLGKLQILCQDPEPWEKREIDFPPFQWLQPRNLVKGGEYLGRGFTAWAYRNDGTRRAIADPLNPTPQEWLDLTYDDLADRAVTTWRKDNPEIVAAWKSLDVAAKNAIRTPGKIFNGTDKISFGVTNKPGFRALVLNLPSGHNLIYPKAKLVWKGDPLEPGESIDWSDNYNTEIQFWGKIPGAQKWGWCKTYGGKLLENATQGICGDFMANGAVEAARHGYEAFMLVHDELIGPQHPGQDHETLCKHLCNLPAWAAGMPLAAEGATLPFYKK